jgi:hypothetical protein
MIVRHRFPGLDGFKGPTAAAALLAALVAGCSINVRGLEGGPPRDTPSGDAAGTTGAGPEAAAATSGGAGGAGGAGILDPATGAGGATSASGAGGGGTSTALTWRSYNVTADAKTGALSVPGDAAATPAATLTAYWAKSVDDTKSTRVALTSYHAGTHNSEDVSWYITDGMESNYPYVGRSASPRSPVQGTLEPQSALDLQVSVKDEDLRSVFIAFAAPVDGLYKLKDVAARRLFLILTSPGLRVYQNHGGAISPVGAALDSGSDQKWHLASSPYDFPMALTTGDQIIFEVNPGSYSYYDVMELVWTIEATVP